MIDPDLRDSVLARVEAAKVAELRAAAEVDDLQDALDAAAAAHRAAMTELNQANAALDELTDPA
jgi:outer membrane murein-binding lipoprotein Lpp